MNDGSYDYSPYKEGEPLIDYLERCIGGPIITNERIGLNSAVAMSNLKGSPGLTLPVLPKHT